MLTFRLVILSQSVMAMTTQLEGGLQTMDIFFCTMYCSHSNRHVHEFWGFQLETL